MSLYIRRVTEELPGTPCYECCRHGRTEEAKKRPEWFPADRGYQPLRPAYLLYFDSHRMNAVPMCGICANQNALACLLMGEEVRCGDTPLSLLLPLGIGGAA